MDVVTLQQAARLFVPSFKHPTLAKLTRNAENVVICCLGDSTGQTQLPVGVGDKRWPRLVCEQIAAMFPAYTVKYHEWSDDAGQAQYNGTTYPDVTIQTGSGTGNSGGPFILDFYNGSISGTVTYSFLGSGLASINRYPGIVGNLDCDLILVSFGQNHAATDKDMAMSGLVEQVTLDNPRASVALIAQNPNLNDLRNAVHASHVMAYAAERGFGFIDVHKVFIDAGSPGTWYVNTAGVPTDGVHPSLLGSTAWANAVVKYLRGPQFPQQQPSTLSTAVESLLLNSDLTDIGNALQSWTMVGGATAAKDATVYDRPTIGFSIKLRAPVANVAQYMLQTITIPPSWRGKWISVAARLYKSPLSSANSGVIEVNDGGGTASASGGAYGTQTYNGWYWAHVPMKISATGTALNIKVYSEFASNNSLTTGFVNVDRVVLVPGRALRDIPNRRQSTFLQDLVIRSQLKLKHSEFSNDSAGLATLVAGTVTVATTALSANDRIHWAFQDAGAGSGTWGHVGITSRTNGTSFTFTSSSNTDTRQIAWWFLGQAG